MPKCRTYDETIAGSLLLNKARGCCPALFLLLLVCISSDQKESEAVLVSNPWLKPFVLNVPIITPDASNAKTKGHNARIRLCYEKKPGIGQKLFPKIDSAALAEGWIETDIRASDIFVDFKTYWRNWHGEYGITGQYNLVIWFCNVNCIILDWQAAPSDSAILYAIKRAHDTGYKGLGRSFYVSQIGRYLAKLPQDHHLYLMLDAELENFLIKDQSAEIRAGAANIYCEWRLQSKYRKAVSLLERSCDDASPLVRLYSATGIMRLGDSENRKALPVLIDFATGNALKRLGGKELMDAGVPNSQVADRFGEIKDELVQKTKKTMRIEAVSALLTSRTESAKKTLELLKTDSIQEIRNIIQNGR
jgi:hypothetical protein